MPVCVYLCVQKVYNLLIQGRIQLFVKGGLLI